MLISHPMAAVMVAIAFSCLSLRSPADAGSCCLRRSPADAGCRGTSFAVAHSVPSHNLLRHRFAITCILRAPPSPRGRGGPRPRPPGHQGQRRLRRVRVALHHPGDGPPPVIAQPFSTLLNPSQPFSTAPQAPLNSQLSARPAGALS